MNFLLISDLDDTIKISNTEKKIITIYRGLFRYSAFSGMAELYTQLTQNSCASENNPYFHIISSSPPAIRKRIEKFLKQNKFPSAILTLRDWIRESSIPKYKHRALEQVLRSSDAPLILIGDDTEYDPEIFTTFAEMYPERVLTIYIRAIKDRPLPKAAKKFYTAFDIACAELAAERLTQEQVLLVGNAVLDAQKHSRLIPTFMKRPPLDFIPFLSQLGNVDQKLLDLWDKIHKKIHLMPKKKS